MENSFLGSSQKTNHHPKSTYPEPWPAQTPLYRFYLVIDGKPVLVGKRRHDSDRAAQMYAQYLTKKFGDLGTAQVEKFE